MNKITTDIITTTGINISKYDILPSKVFINGIEITDTGTWNKVISSIDVKNKEIDRLNNIINKAIEDVDALMEGRYSKDGVGLMFSPCCNKRLEVIKKDLEGDEEC